MNEYKDRDPFAPEEPEQPQRDSESGNDFPPRYDDHLYPPRRPAGSEQQEWREQGERAPGSEQRPPQNDRYTWNFDDYDRARRRRKSAGNRGVVVFTVLLVSVLSVGMIALAGYSIWSALPGNAIADSPSQSGQPAADPPKAADGETAEPGQQLQIAQTPQNDQKLEVGGALTIPEVAQMVTPSVVGVVTFAGDQYYESSGYGSGIVMSEDGYIITNAHVVSGGTGFKVQFNDGTAYDAALVGSDAVTDLAVLKIDAEGLTPATFGDSDAVQVGELAVAIGNPGGDVLASSVTQGIISAVNREVQTSNYRMTFLQTDAAINPGNSGGALANRYGQVIGINSAKIAASGYEGIGFAIPISTAKPIVDDIIQNGKVTGRVMLGVTCRVVDEIDARNMDIPMGLLIETVEANSDLSSSGVEANDILTHIDGERVYTLADVRDVLDQHKAGDTVTLTFFRRVGVTDREFDVQTRLIESQ